MAYDDATLVDCALLCDFYSCVNAGRCISGTLGSPGETAGCDIEVMSLYVKNKRAVKPFL